MQAQVAVPGCMNIARTGTGRQHSACYTHLLTVLIHSISHSDSVDTVTFRTIATATIAKYVPICLSGYRFLKLASV